MINQSKWFLVLTLYWTTTWLTAHHLGQSNGYDFSVTPETRPILLSLSEQRSQTRDSNALHWQLEAFSFFPKLVKAHTDDQFVYVEGRGMPGHPMMIGITAWQQQVPLPQEYFGENAWRFPIHPIEADTPTILKGRFLRGAVALGVNGIPIFNPQNNRGDLSVEIGELDQWGGHCGRADDYHYHVTPLHLTNTVGIGRPVAFALDGYAIYGETEPNGNPPTNLDECHGHFTTGLGYHYHGSSRRPYVQAGFHGLVAEKGGQVDPQPSAKPIRKDLPPLKGASIIGFSQSADEKGALIDYAIAGKFGHIAFTNMEKNRWKFTFVGTDGTVGEETYASREGAGPGEGRKNEPDRQKENTEGEKKGRGPERVGQRDEPDTDYGFSELKDCAVVVAGLEAGGRLPARYTCDGESLAPAMTWGKLPKETKSIAVIMSHRPGPGALHVYWLVYGIPPSVTALSENDTQTGLRGLNTVNRRKEYAPPCSQGKGDKTYTMTVYALSSETNPRPVNGDLTRSAFLDAVKSQVIGQTSVSFLYARPTEPANSGQSSRKTKREPGKTTDP